MQAVFEELAAVPADWKGPKFTASTLMAQGVDLDIPLLADCTANCLKLLKDSRKGSPGNQLSCHKCLRKFHLKCMEAEGLIPKGWQRLICQILGSYASAVAVLWKRIDYKCRESRNPPRSLQDCPHSCQSKAKWSKKKKVSAIHTPVHHKQCE
jgi:hypothetical protein